MFQKPDFGGSAFVMSPPIRPPHVGHHDALWTGITSTVESALLWLQLPVMLIAGQLSPADAQVTGPVGIAQMVGGAVSATIDTGMWYPILRLSAVLSAALASDGLMRALPGLRLDLLLDLSTVHFHLGELHPCEALARSALALARQASLPDKRVTALNNIGVALLNRGEAALALPVLQEAAELARACGCLLYTSPSPRDRTRYRMPSSA